MRIGGALVHNVGFNKPSSTDGLLIYLNAKPDVQHILERVERHGGKIIVHQT